MATDWIPHSDADFDPWQKNYLSYAATNTASLGLVPGDVTPLTNAQAVWTAAYAAHVAAKAAAQNKDKTPAPPSKRPCARSPSKSRPTRP